MAWSDVFNGAPATGARPDADLGPYPYISGFGLLQRVTRLGMLQPAEVSQLGFRNRATMDVLAGTQQARAPRNRLVEALGLQQTGVAAHWAVEPWSPARLGGVLDREPGLLRRCLPCARHGFHTAIFQLPTITHCPWHGEPLVTRCPACARPSAARFDGKGRLGRCSCGHDPFRVASAASGMWDFPTQAADSWLTQYLDWATTEREHRWIVLPEVPEGREPVLQALAPPPRILQPPVRHSLSVTLFDGSSEPPPEATFRGWSLFGSDRPLTFVPLPASLHGRLCDATLEVVRGFPDELGTPMELVYSRDFDAGQGLESNVINRPDCFIAPFAPAGDQTLWLNLSAVDPGIAVFCGRLLERVAADLVPARPPDEMVDRSRSTLQSHQLETLEGAKHLLDALEAVLVQGYKQGLDAILRSMAKLSRSGSRTWLVPAVEIVGEPGTLRAVRVCFATAAPPALRRVVDVPVRQAARTASRRGKPRKGRPTRRKVVRVR